MKKITFWWIVLVLSAGLLLYIQCGEMIKLEQTRQQIEELRIEMKALCAGQCQ